jgi:hypothetical protein
MTTRLEQSEKAFSPEHRERLRPILAQLDAAGKSTFLDLCELVLMVAEGIDGSIKWDHPRVTVHIRKKPRPKASKAVGVRGKS